VLDGQLALNHVGSSDTLLARPGDVIVVPANTEHSFVAVGEVGATAIFGMARRVAAVQRVCLRFAIRPGTGEEFDRRHVESWPELVPALREAGFSNYSLFRQDEEVVAYGECEPDAETCFGRMAGVDVFPAAGTTGSCRRSCPTRR